MARLLREAVKDAPTDPKLHTEPECKTVANVSIFVTACFVILWVLMLSMTRLSPQAIAPDVAASAQDYR